MDDYVGELVAKVHNLGIERNTLIIFTSDNGPTGVRGRPSLERFASTAGLRGMKGMVFEGGIRVPMIAWWPGKIAAGASTEEVTTFWDVLPTFAELVGRAELTTGDGHSFARVMLGHGQMPGERVLYWAVRDRKAVRYGDWKWVHHPMDSRSDFLFNIVDDPNELTNLASKHPEVMSRLQHMGDEVVGN
jgi:arylsulfatase A